jgi:hypothetical protein
MVTACHMNLRLTTMSKQVIEIDVPEGVTLSKPVINRDVDSGKITHWTIKPEPIIKPIRLCDIPNDVLLLLSSGHGEIASRIAKAGDVVQSEFKTYRYLGSTFSFCDFLKGVYYNWDAIGDSKPPEGFKLVLSIGRSLNALRVAKGYCWPHEVKS